MSKDLDELDQLYKLKREISEKERESHEAAGALAQSIKTLEDNFRCSSLAEAKKLWRLWDRRLATATRRFREELSNFKKKYPELFNSDE